MDMETRLTVFADLMSSVDGVSFWKYDGEGRLVFTNCPGAEMFDTLFAVGECKTRLMEASAQSDMPYVIMNTLSLVWFAASYKVNGVLIGLYVIGPVFPSPVSESNIQKILSADSGAPFQWKTEFYEQVKSLPVVQHSNFIQFGRMLYHCIYGNAIDFYDVQILKTQNESAKTSADDEPGKLDSHNSFTYEQMLVKAIETGNVDFKKPPNPPNVGRLSKGDSLRQAKNEAVVFITLASRAAMRGGLPEETAYSLSDAYIQMVEEQAKPSDVFPFANIVFNDYLRRVHKHKISGGRSRDIQNCVAYIETHITEKIDHESLAKILGYSRNYLSSKFAKEMGTTINEYITEQKLELAKLWLQSSSKSVNEIALSLNFGSNSYFGHVFRKRVGCSPSDYRHDRGGDVTGNPAPVII